MPHPLTLRILVSLASLWPYFAWKREVRRENECRAMRERLATAIRGY